MNFIVLDDPKGEYWDGALVDEAMAKRLAGRGCCVFPSEPELHRKNAVCGFFKRSWGAGWPLDPTLPKAVCPTMLYVVPGFTFLHWRARIQLDAALLGDRLTDVPPLEGSLRLVNDTAQACTVGGGMSAVGDTVVYLSKLGQPDERGGYTIGGSARLNTVMENYHGFALYGVGRGVRVVWCAVGQSG